MTSSEAWLSQSLDSTGKKAYIVQVVHREAMRDQKLLRQMEKGTLSRGVRPKRQLGGVRRL